MRNLKYVFYSFFICIGAINMVKGQNIQKSNYTANQIDSIFLIKEGEKKAGIAAIVHLNNKPIYQKSFGYSNLDRKTGNRTATTNCRFREPRA